MSIDRRKVMAGAAGAALAGTATAARAATHQVTVISRTSQWDPKELTIRRGDTVEWTNTAPIPHRVTFNPATAKDPKHVSLPAGVEPFESPELKRGEKFSYTFTTRGMYHYCCRLHEDLNMMGMITVR